MFYDHKILTSKKNGVATIWLVATLGSGSSLRKVTRKAILDVKIADACESIISPEVPMALRLQGRLLYGISRVFSQQCGYILADVESLRGKMRSVTVALRDTQIDRTVGVARAGQLNLHDDPDFNIDFDFSLDMSAFGLDHSSSSSSVLSPHSLRSSQSSFPVDEDEPGLVLPSVSDDPNPDYFDLGQGLGTSSVVRSIDYRRLSDVLNEPAIYDDLDFQVNGEGDIMIFGDDEATAQVDLAGAVQPVAGGRSESAAAGFDFDDNQTDIVNQRLEDLDLNFDDEVMPIMNDKHTTPSLPRASPEPAHEQQHSSPQPNGDNKETVITADAPQRRRIKRAGLPLKFDFVQELGNGDLAAWSTSYVENMKANGEEQMARKSLNIAKRNAAFWILDQGIGSVQTNFGNDTEIHPFAVFSGENLLNALTGAEPAAGKKRSLSPSSLRSEDEGRRVRSRSERLQVGRGDDILPVIGTDDDILPQDDYPESEVGRRAASSLKDRSSQMPWNLLSRQGSAKPYESALRAYSSSVGGHGNAELGPPSDQARQRRRLTSASPLVGKGRQLSHPDIDLGDQTISTNFNLDDFGDIEDRLAGDIDDGFQLDVPATGLSTQTAAQGQWLAAALEKEAHNFLEYLHTSIQQKLSNQDSRGDSQEVDATITLDTLLPFKQNSKAVGAQALLHVLTLATRGIIRIEQTGPFGDIQMAVVGDLPYSAAGEGAEMVEIEA